MSKYDNLWKYIQKSDSSRLDLTFDEIERISGAPLDHSFLNLKKELTEYGYVVKKISMKTKTVIFVKKEEN